ncbi:MAG: HEAT repeat domain-containing protein [Anaerolineae bacterium]|nr:HEAT repeat domain-containing protein [Anaerolineae bacterium]
MGNPSFQSIVDRLYALGDGYVYEFEAFRDEILALGPGAMKAVLEEALSERATRVLDLFVTVLADSGYPSALPHFVDWLDHESDEVRFAAVCALDKAAGGRFAVGRMVERGWVQREKILALIPSVKAWWHEEGRHTVPSETDWHAEQAAKPTYTEREKWYNFVEINPMWVMLGSRRVFRAEKGFLLPRNEGYHVVAGTVQVKGEAEPRLAAFEMDSYAGEIARVFVKERGWWIDVTGLADWATPNISF